MVHPDESNFNHETCSTRTRKRLANLYQDESSDKTSVKIFLRSLSALETLNTDCLIQLFDYLNIMDAINLTATCTTMFNFAKADFFPRKAKQITIYMSGEQYLLMAPLINDCKPKFTMNNLETALSYFGDFVVDLTLNLTRCRGQREYEKARLWHSSVILLEHFKYLTTLRYRHWCLTAPQTHELQMQIERFAYLNELDLLECNGITNNWPPAMKCNSNVNKITLNGANKIADNFVEYFSNLSILNIEFDYWTVSHLDDVTKILNTNGHCLKHLKLAHLDNIDGYEPIEPVIANNLPKLESLWLQFKLTDYSKPLIALPHLKCLEIGCDRQTINALLRTLSDNGIIKQLKMYGGFLFNDFDEPPLIFNNLQSFNWICAEGMQHNSFKTINKSLMPKIHTFLITLCNGITQSHENDLLKFIESKKTLKSMCFRAKYHNFNFEFLRQIIVILKKPCTPKRPFLTLTIAIVKLTEEEVS